jgi:hypothetical protein
MKHWQRGQETLPLLRPLGKLNRAIFFALHSWGYGPQPKSMIVAPRGSVRAPLPYRIHTDAFRTRPTASPRQKLSSNPFVSIGSICL